MTLGVKNNDNIGSLDARTNVKGQATKGYVYGIL
jgi:hypothetical protein